MLLIVAPCALSLLAEMLAPAAAATEATTGASASEQLAPAHSRGFGALAAVAYGAALCAATQGHLEVWRDSRALWSRSLALEPSDGVSASSLGFALHRELGALREGAVCYSAAAALQPQRAGTLAQLGHAYKEAGDLARAEATFRRLLALDPSSLHVGAHQYADGLDSLGLVQAAAATTVAAFVEAEGSHRAALRLHPAHPGAYINMQCRYIKESPPQPPPPLLRFSADVEVQLRGP